MRLRQRYWLALGFDVAVLVLIFVSIAWWQSRHLLAADGSQQAPQVALSSLDGQTYAIGGTRDQRTLVYFFAPWCHVCGLSVGNLEWLRRSYDDQSLTIYLVALSYDSVAEVQAFVDDHGVTLPVLLGDARIMADYRIRGFPTYYVIDDDGSLRHRAVGYSTFFGLWWRSL
ncbi:MAG: hypothetical protein Tsb002_16170 [Wenzhouxiangellaceae bacterium]